MQTDVITKKVDIEIHKDYKKSTLILQMLTTALDSHIRIKSGKAVLHAGETMKMTLVCI